MKIKIMILLASVSIGIVGGIVAYADETLDPRIEICAFIEKEGSRYQSIQDQFGIEEAHRKFQVEYDEVFIYFKAALERSIEMMTENEFSEVLKVFSDQEKNSLIFSDPSVTSREKVRFFYWIKFKKVNGLICRISNIVPKNSGIKKRFRSCHRCGEVEPYVRGFF